MIKYIKPLLIIFFIFAIFPFGGFVKSQIRCDNGILLFVGPPRGGLFMLMPGAIIYARGTPSAGRWVLGQASLGGACVIVRPHSTTVIPAIGTILRVGSS